MPFECQRAATVEELVSLHDVQAYRQARCQNSRCRFGASQELLERHRPAGGTAAPAGVPPRQRFDALVRAVSESLGACWKNSQRGFEEREPSGARRLWACASGRSLSNRADLSVETSSCVRLGGAGLRSRPAPRLPPRGGAGCVGKAATWLILPVVICLSQRLSHACLSINCLYCETANGSLNQL